MEQEPASAKSSAGGPDSTDGSLSGPAQSNPPVSEEPVEVTYYKGKEDPNLPDQSKNQSDLPNQGVPSIIKPSHQNPLKKPSIILLILFFALIVIGGVGYVASYNNIRIPYVPQGVADKIDSAVVKTPFLPKTARQIISQSVRDDFNLSSFNQDLDITASLESKYGGESEVISASLKASGAVEKVDADGSNFSHNLKIDAQADGKTYNFDLDFRLVGGDIYFNLKDAPKNLGDTYYRYDFRKIKGKWYQLLDETVNNFYSNKNKDIDETEEISKLIKTLEEKKVFEQIKKLPDEDIEGVATYHLSYAPNKEIITEIITNYYSEAISEELKDAEIDEEELKKWIGIFVSFIDHLQIDFWVSKDNFLVVKAKFDLMVSMNPSAFLGGVGSDSGKIIFKLSFTNLLKDINNAPKVEVPKDATKITLEELSDKVIRRIEPSPICCSPLSSSEQVLGEQTAPKSLWYLPAAGKILHNINSNPLKF